MVDTSGQSKAAAIAAAIEAAKGPVGPGHHNSHRTSNIEAWVKANPKKAYVPGSRKKKRQSS